MNKQQGKFVVVTFLCLTALVGGFFYYDPLHWLSVQQKAEQPPQKIYDYYLIIDEKSGEVLMYVPLVVSPGDEVITEKNQRFRVVKVVENQAFARFVEDVKLKKVQPPQ